MSALNVGDRVEVRDEGLAKLRDIMRRATGKEPEPNHLGKVEEIWEEGRTILVLFDDDYAAPYPADMVFRLEA